MTGAGIQPQANPERPVTTDETFGPSVALRFLGSRFPEYRHKHVWSHGNDHHFRINRYAQRASEAGGLSETYIADSKHVVVKVSGDRIDYEDQTLN